MCSRLLFLLQLINIVSGKVLPGDLNDLFYEYEKEVSKNCSLASNNNTYSPLIPVSKDSIVENITLDNFFANTTTKELLHEYIRDGVEPALADDHGKFSRIMFWWWSLITVICILAAFCAFENIGILTCKSLVSYGTFKGGIKTTIIKWSLLLIGAVTAALLIIYLLIVIFHNPNDKAEEVLCELDIIREESVVQHKAENGDILWDNTKFGSIGSDFLINETEHRVLKLKPLFDEYLKFAKDISALAVSLPEKSISLYEKIFVFPLNNANSSLKLPPYQALNASNGTNIPFLFNSTLDNLQRVHTEYDKLFSIFSTFDSSQIFSLLQNQDGQELFNHYLDDRIEFAIELGYYSGNFIKFIEQYYSDKFDLSDSYFLLYVLSLILTITAVGFGGASTYINNRICKYTMLALWAPFALLGIWFIFGIMRIVKDSAAVYTGCNELIETTNNFTFETPAFSKFKVYVERNPIEQISSTMMPASVFSERLESCGSPGGHIYNSEELNKILANKRLLIENWYKYMNPFEFVPDFIEDKPQYFINLLRPFYRNESTFFFQRSELGNAALQDSLDFISNLTTYEANTLQSSEGECHKTRDIWVWNKEGCHQGYKYQENNGVFNISIDSIDGRNCFGITEWDIDSVRNRYRSALKDCRILDPETNTTFASKTEDALSQAITSANMLSSSITSTYIYFINMTTSIQNWQFTQVEFEKSVKMESNYVDRLSQLLFIYSTGNDCLFLKEMPRRFEEVFCASELVYFDQLQQVFLLFALGSTVMMIVLGILGFGYYENPSDFFDQNMEYREMEIESCTYDNKSMHSMNSGHKIYVSRFEEDYN